MNKNKKIKKLRQLPSEEMLEKIRIFITERENHKSETKRWVHYCIFLLCLKSGLRVNEAINFDLNLEHPSQDYKNLYLILGKGNKQRYIYVSQEIAEELKKLNWKPKESNRRNFWEFLKTIKKDMEIENFIELEPHTLRRCFATYNLLSGMPLSILQRILGHSKISTTAIYIKDRDIANLLKYKPIN